MFFRAVVLMVSFFFFASAAMATSCNKVLATQNLNEGLFFEAGEAEFEVTGTSVLVDESSDFANFYGSSFLIQDIRLHDLNQNQGFVDNLFNKGYRLSTQDAIVLDEICRQLTNGSHPYVASEWTRFETVTPVLRRLGLASFYTDRGGFLSVEFSQANQSVEVIKDLRCLKNTSVD